MEQATDKQQLFLMKNGINAANMSKSDAHAKIQELIGVKNEAVNTKPHFNSFKPKQETYEKPKSSSSFYISYSKDICIELLKMEKNQKVSIDILMEASIMAVKQAIEAFRE